jgi:poly(hydroxyalkanoate) depolymerase family esterase
MRRRLGCGAAVALVRGATVLVALLVAAVLADAACAAPADAPRRGTFDGLGYRLYVPPGAGGGAPLVVALHGCWQTPEDFARGTRLNEAAERRGLVVLYPAQSALENPMRCWNWFATSGAQGGVDRLLALVRRVIETEGVAPDRVVVLGLSAGGFMAVNLLCAAPELFMGVGVAAGGPYRCGVGAEGAVGCMRGQGLPGAEAAAACRARMGPRARPVRASLWHGANDTVVSPENLESLALMFRQLGGLGAPGEARVGGAVHVRWLDARGRAMLETWLVAGMGHAWSGGHPRGTHTYPPGPDATERMLDFLLGPAPRP